MKFLKILLGLYQAIIVCLSLTGIFAFLYAYFTPSPDSCYRWHNIFLAALLLVPTIVFCFCNALRLFMPSRNIFSGWKSLPQTSIVFTILWTFLFGYLLIFQTSCNGGSRSSAVRTDSLNPGQAAPAFSITPRYIGGETISLSGLTGKVVLLDFWGVWCGPCRAKLPHTQELYDKFKDQGLAVIGIHSPFRTEGMSEFIAENNYTFPVGIDPGSVALEYEVRAWPTYYLIDPDVHRGTAF